MDIKVLQWLILKTDFFQWGRVRTSFRSKRRLASYMFEVSEKCLEILEQGWLWWFIERVRVELAGRGSMWITLFSTLDAGASFNLILDFKSQTPNQRWANSVFGTEYKYEYYSVSEIWPNTNTIQVPKYCRIRVRILFGFRNLASLRVKNILFSFQTSIEYEYEYYLGLEKHANTNTNIFGFEKLSEYEYKYY